VKIKFFDFVTQIDDLPEHNLGAEAVGKVELLDIVAITQDFPEHNLRRGEVGTVVHVFSNDDAFEVEFSDRNGQAYQFLSLRASQLIVLHHEPMRTGVDSISEPLIAD